MIEKIVRQIKKMLNWIIFILLILVDIALLIDIISCAVKREYISLIIIFIMFFCVLFCTVRLYGSIFEKNSFKIKKFFQLKKVDKINNPESERTVRSRELIDYMLKNGEISVTLVKERLGCDDHMANVYLDGIEKWLKENPDFDIIINRENSLKHYDDMGGHEFEQFCAYLLGKSGFINVEVTSGSGDYGVDILAEKDGITYAIQCKCYSSNIGNKAVQEIYSGKDFYKRHIGVVLTNQYFTDAAKETAERTGIVLWDRVQLENLIRTSGF